MNVGVTTIASIGSTSKVELEQYLKQPKLPSIDPQILPVPLFVSQTQNVVFFSKIGLHRLFFEKY